MFGFLEWTSGTATRTRPRLLLMGREPRRLAIRSCSQGFRHCASRAKMGFPDVVTFSQVHVSTSSTPLWENTPPGEHTRSMTAGLFVTHTATVPSAAGGGPRGGGGSGGRGEAGPGAGG